MDAAILTMNSRYECDSTISNQSGYRFYLFPIKIFDFDCKTVILHYLLVLLISPVNEGKCRYFMNFYD